MCVHFAFEVKVCNSCTNTRPKPYNQMYFYFFSQLDTTIGDFGLLFFLTIVPRLEVYSILHTVTVIRQREKFLWLSTASENGITHSHAAYYDFFSVAIITKRKRKTLIKTHTVIILNCVWFIGSSFFDNDREPWRQRRDGQFFRKTTRVATHYSLYRI